MKSLVQLSEQILRDCGIRCGVDPTMDIKTVHRRVENEGISFLTITLPSYGKAFDMALATGRFESSMVPACRFRRGLPIFLRGFLSKIFNNSGDLLDEPCSESIAAVRLITRFASKVKLECTERRKRAAEQEFIKCENELRGHKYDVDLLEEFERTSSIILSDILKEVPFGDPYEFLVPKHGPGATQERIRGNSKYRFRTWHSRLEEQFPFTEFAMGSIRDLGEKDCPLQTVKFVEPGAEKPVRVVFVPKTLKTPRVIAIEPVCNQYIQQSLLNFLTPLIETSSITGGRVNFTHQSVNKELALLNSVTGRLATVDLKEASDRVSCLLVDRLLMCAPRLRDMVFACRSTRATLPSGLTLTLEKFASMGSALCFPMEALVFFSAIVTLRIREAKETINIRSVRKYAQDVYVYGDDILIPADEAPTICDHLGLFGLKVNTTKTFCTGKFRESCGMDAFDGMDVTPVYCRHLQPADRKSSKEVIAWTEMANLFYSKGYWLTARWIRARVEETLRMRLPHKTKTSQGLGWTSFSELRTIQRWNKHLHRFEYRTLVPTPVRHRDPLEGDGALLKCLKIIGLPSINLTHLTETVRRGTLALKFHWVPS